MSFLPGQDRTPKFAGQIGSLDTNLVSQVDSKTQKKLKKKIEKNFDFDFFDFIEKFLFLKVRSPVRKTSGFRTVRIIALYLFTVYS
jgi:hypothetical protein